MVMPYKPCNFRRQDYLEHREVFDSVKLEDAQEELTEFSDDAEDLAFELAYTRFRVADLEEFIRHGVEFGYISIPDKGDRARKTIDEIMKA